MPAMISLSGMPSARAGGKGGGGVLPVMRTGKGGGAAEIHHRAPALVAQDGVLHGDGVGHGAADGQGGDMLARRGASRE